MTIRVLATPEAEHQIDSIASWWRRHREKAPFLFEEELGTQGAMDRLVEHPDLPSPAPTVNSCNFTV